MNRITPEEVVAAYKELGWKASRGFYRRDNCGCGLGVIMESLGIDSAERQCLGTLGAWRGYVMSYLSGFIFGFDGDSLPFCASDDLKLGHEDGDAARQAVTKEGLWA